MLSRQDKTKILSFRVTEKMGKRILSAADAEGMTTPDWIRHQVAEAVKAAEREDGR